MSLQKFALIILFNPNWTLSLLNTNRMFSGILKMIDQMSENIKLEWKKEKPERAGFKTRNKSVEQTLG